MKRTRLFCGAALLHDTIEDAAVTFDHIATQYGDDVAGLVAELTNDNRMPKARRRSEMMEKLSKLSPRAKRSSSRTASTTSRIC